MNNVSSRGNICLCVPWRDREHLIPYTLEGIINQTYPKNKIGLKFVVNDSRDDTFKILMKFKYKYKELFRFINVWNLHMGSPRDERNANVRRKTLWNMKLIKNFMRDSLLPRDEYMMYMDCDIILEPDTIQLLMDADKDVIAGLCRTDRNDGIFNFLMREEHMDRFSRRFDYEPIVKSEVPVQVDFIGGIFLIKYAITQKIVFRQVTKETFSEDEGAMRDMMRLGINRWIHPKAFVHHIMTQEMLDDYIKTTGSKGLDLTGVPEVNYATIVEDGSNVAYNEEV